MARVSIFIMICSFYTFLQAQIISQDSLKRLLTIGSSYDFLLIDVRQENELSSMIGSTACKPYNLAWPDQFKEEFGKIGKDQIVYLYCRSGSRAGQAVEYIKGLGYLNVYNAGGIQTWKGPTVTKSDMLPRSDLPKPSMRKSDTPVVFHASAKHLRTVNSQGFLCLDCHNLLIADNQYYYDLSGHREIRTKHACTISKKGVHRKVN